MQGPHLLHIASRPECTPRTEERYLLCQRRSGKKRSTAASFENLRLWQCMGAAA